MTSEAQQLRDTFPSSSSIKTAWLDLETTGLNPTRYAIHQLALVVFDKNERYELTMDIQPHAGASVSDEALAHTNTPAQKLQTGLNPPEAHRELKSFMNQFVAPRDKTDKFFLYGYNVRFDEDFLRSFFLRQNDNFFGSWF